MLTKKETKYNYIYVLNIDTHKESWKHTKLIKLIAFFVNLIRNHGYFIWSVILMLDTCWILDTSRTLLYACSNCVLFLKLKKKNVGHSQDTRTRGIEYPSQNKEKIHTLNYNIAFEN